MCRYLNLPRSYKESLIKQRHPKRLVYPTRKYLKEHGVKRQNKVWDTFVVEFDGIYFLIYIFSAVSELPVTSLRT